MISDILLFFGGGIVGYSISKIVCKHKEECVCKDYKKCSQSNDFTQSGSKQ